MGGILELVVTPLLLAVLLTYFLTPPVRYLNKQGLSRAAAILTIYLFLTVLLILFCFNIFPALLEELEEMVALLPEYTERSMLFLEKLERRLERFGISPGMHAALFENIRALKEMLSQLLEKMAIFLLSAVRQILALLLVPLFAFYFLRDSRAFKKWLLHRLPASFRDKMEHTLADVNKILGAYLRGIVIVSFAVGILFYFGLLILGVEFALVLALLNALLNVVPYFGPFLGAVPIFIVALHQSPELAWKAVLLVLIVQQAETQLIAPRVFSRELGFHPLVIVIILLLGGIYLGFFGLVFSVPLAAVCLIFIRQFSPLLKQALLRGKNNGNNWL